VNCHLCLLLTILWLSPDSLLAESSKDTADARFEGKHYRGEGDAGYLRLLETARRMFEPDPELQNVAMLYTPLWDGFVEGPTWDAWWIQNSYGTTYCALPFYQEPLVTFLQHAQDLWFDQMGDGRRVGSKPPYDWAAPDGVLCDCAQPGRIIYRQGDGNYGMHDWAIEFTAAGVLLQSELLLISRDGPAIAHYLPLLERCGAFIETRRDPTNNLFLAGPAGNLLAPSYAGWKRPDGSWGKAYLTGLSVTYIAALDRLIEVEKLAGREARAADFARRRDLAKSGLARLTAPAGYFIRSLDPDGVRHGVLGAEHYGYFEASPNHDAIAFRVADDEQARKIYGVIAQLPGLRPHDFILPNYPSYDDMYTKPEGLWAYGTWVNGGHWSTCEARMMLGYYRLGKFEDARRSMERLLAFARAFRMDNPLTKCGGDVYQPHEPINLCYDTFGPAAGFMRGLFEYLYSADGLTLIPHIPPGITELEQCDPVRFGTKQVYCAVRGRGPITGVFVNGKKVKRFEAQRVFLAYRETPSSARVLILLGGAKRASPRAAPSLEAAGAPKPRGKPPENAQLQKLDGVAVKLAEFRRRLARAGLEGTYAAAHARLALDYIETARTRFQRLAEGTIARLPEASQKAADQSYLDTAEKLSQGLDKVIQGYGNAGGPAQQKVRALWLESAAQGLVTEKGAAVLGGKDSRHQNLCR
jgi:hypothetical protein